MFFVGQLAENNRLLRLSEKDWWWKKFLITPNPESCRSLLFLSLGFIPTLPSTPISHTSVFSAQPPSILMQHGNGGLPGERRQWKYQKELAKAGHGEGKQEMEPYQGSVRGPWGIPVPTSDVRRRRENKAGSPDTEEPQFTSSLSVGLRAHIPSLPITGWALPQGPGELREDVCNPWGIWNKSKTRKETSPHVPFTKGHSFWEAERVLLKWRFLACERELVSEFSEIMIKESWDYDNLLEPLILIMKEEMVTIRKFPRRGYTRTEGRMVVIFFRSNTIPLWTPQNAAYGA